MAGKTIDYFFCMNSPWVYLGQRRLEEIAGRRGARISYHPVDLREMMLRLIGRDDPPERSELHRAYGKRDMERWAAFYGLPLSDDPRHYPVSQHLAARVVVAADRFGADVAPLVLALPRAVWAEDRDIADKGVLTAICEECGLPGDILLRAADDTETLERFGANTDEALARGVFGIPSYVVDGEIFWGQDRLDFVERALAAA